MPRLKTAEESSIIEYRQRPRACIIGFDSAWTARRTGAICSIDIGSDESRTFVEPELASFDAALDFIRRKSDQSQACFVAVDQPTIVPNQTGMRPVERVAASLVSHIGGGVQPANRSRKGMFDDAAPIWTFLSQLKTQLHGTENPVQSRTCMAGLHLIEVFPALSVAAFENAFFGPRKVPKYNPERRGKFRLRDWAVVATAIAAYAEMRGIDELAAWAIKAAGNQTPTKSDQDRLDAVLCALICYHWRYEAPTESVMIGDLIEGYMITRVSEQMLKHLRKAAALRAVAIA